MRPPPAHDFDTIRYSVLSRTFKEIMRPEPMGRRSRPVEMAFRHSGAAMAPGPARLKAAVDVIVDHLRRLVLREAWDKWQPTLSQVQASATTVFGAQAVIVAPMPR